MTLITASRRAAGACFGQNSYDAVASGTVASVTAFGQSLVANPYFAGLSNPEIASVINFNANAVPLPGTLALIGIGSPH